MAGSIKFHGAMQNVGLSTVITDNLATALDIEGTDGEDYIRADTTDDASKLMLLSTFTEADNVSSGFVGLRTATPSAPLHIIGTGGSTGISIDPTAANAPVVVIENSDSNSMNRCTVLINSDGGAGSVVQLHHEDTRRLILNGLATRSFVRGDQCILKVDTSGAFALELGTNEIARLTINKQGRMETGVLSNSAGSSHFTGAGNVAIGDATTLDAVNNNSAAYNTAIGSGALTGVTTGSNQIGIGKDAGSNITGGEGCTYVGWDTKASGATPSFETAIGYNAQGRGSYSLALGHHELGQTLVNNGAPTRGVFLRHGHATVTNAPWIIFERNLHASHANDAAESGSNTLVTDNTILGGLTFWGADGTDFNAGASIFARIDGTPSGGTDMPTEIVFATSSEADNDGIPGENEWLTIGPTGLLSSPAADASWSLLPAGTSGANDGSRRPNMLPDKRDTDTGMWVNGANVLTLSTAGYDRVVVNAAGAVFMHNLPTADPNVSGQLYRDGSGDNAAILFSTG